MGPTKSTQRIPRARSNEREIGRLQTSDGERPAALLRALGEYSVVCRDAKVMAEPRKPRADYYQVLGVGSEARTTSQIFRMHEHDVLCTSDDEGPRMVVVESAVSAHRLPRL